jgi:hypothetical protein
MQRASPPPLLPLLRSRLQAEILTLVLLGPGKEWTLTGSASRTGASVSSVQREIARAEQAGVVSSRRPGNVRLVEAGDSPLTTPLTELLLRSFGPRQVLAEELEGVEGIESAYLFGSWAARYAGEAGRPPADLDILVIGVPDRDELDDAAQRAEGRLARRSTSRFGRRSGGERGQTACMPTSPGARWSRCSAGKERDELGNGRRAHPGAPQSRGTRSGSPGHRARAADAGGRWAAPGHCGGG